MDQVSLLRFVFSFLLVVGLIGLFAYVLKRWPALRGLGAVAPGKARLRVVEQRSIDARHKLVLVERDNVQHLLLMMPEHAVVVESAIAPKTEEESHAA